MLGIFNILHLKILINRLIDGIFEQYNNLYFFYSFEIQLADVKYPLEHDQDMLEFVDKVEKNGRDNSIVLYEDDSHHDALRSRTTINVVAIF